MGYNADLDDMAAEVHWDEQCSDSNDEPKDGRGVDANGNPDVDIEGSLSSGENRLKR
jgi:hypothetical protein